MEVLIAERLEHTAIEHVAVAAVVGVRLDIRAVGQPAFGRAAVHFDAEFARVFVELDGEVGGFLVEGAGPVEPAAAEAVLGDEAPQFIEVVVGEMLPERDDGLTRRPARRDT